MHTIMYLWLWIAGIYKHEIIRQPLNHHYDLLQSISTTCGIYFEAILAWDHDIGLFLDGILLVADALQHLK